MLMIWFNAESLLILLKQDPEVAHLASIYLRWVSLGLPGANGKQANSLMPFLTTSKNKFSLCIQLHQQVCRVGSEQVYPSINH